MHDNDKTPMLLTDADRCDTCGSRAFVRAVINSDQMLMFCCHHWDRNKAALSAYVHTHEDTAGILDESRFLSDVFAVR